MTTTQAWQRQYVDYFDCQPCADGLVPIAPNSNLEPYYDASAQSWKTRIVSTAANNGARVRSQAARAKVKSAAAAAAAAGGDAAAASAAAAANITARRVAVAPSARQQVAKFFDRSQKAILAASSDTEVPW